MIAIIDYGAGNLHSVQNALAALGEQTVITNKPGEILGADKVILPGVGAFADAMDKLCKTGMDQVVHQLVEMQKPLLGICLGMQLFFEKSEEAPGVKGLGVLKGNIVRIPPAEGLKIPHMGWNSLLDVRGKLLNGLGSEPYVYFVHSYYLEAEDQAAVSAYTQYGKKLAIAIEQGNLFATQFHPEKSGTVGMQILKNFLSL